MRKMDKHKKELSLLQSRYAKQQQSIINLINQFSDGKQKQDLRTAFNYLKLLPRRMKIHRLFAQRIINSNNFRLISLAEYALGRKLTYDEKSRMFKFGGDIYDIEKYFPERFIEINTKKQLLQRNYGSSYQHNDKIKAKPVDFKGFKDREITDIENFTSKK